MREIRLYGSEGGEAKAFPTPINVRIRCGFLMNFLLIMLSTKDNNEKLTKILCYTESVFSPYYHNIPNAAL